MLQVFNSLCLLFAMIFNTLSKLALSTITGILLGMQTSPDAFGGINAGNVLPKTGFQTFTLLCEYLCNM